MKNFYITINTIDPKSKIPDEKVYGFSLIAKNEKDAENKAVKQFKVRYKDYPINSVNIF